MTTETRIYYRDLLPSNVKNLFGYTYWANFKTDRIDTIKRVTELANNRELIAIRYNLKYTNARYPKYVESETRMDLADHTEVYKNKDNEWVIIQSPYGCLENQRDGVERQQYFINKGYTIIEPVYSHDAISFIKIISKKKNNDTY